MDFETTFKQNRQVLLNLARANSLKCGSMIQTEDFYSQGCEIFIKCFNRYDPNKAQFNTYFIGSCKIFFKSMIVKETIRQINRISTRNVYTDEPDPEQRISFMDKISKLSNDAVEIIMLVLKTPSDFVDDLSKSTIRSFFMKRWKGNGKGLTAHDRVKFAFSEIKETLNDF